MSLWGRVKTAVVGAVKAVAGRVLSIRDPNHWRNAGDISAAGENVNERSALALSAVWACVNLLAGTIGSLPLMVYRTDRNGSRTVAYDHPLYRILHDSPNYEQTALDFMEFVVAAIELRGNAVARKIFTGSRLSALAPVGVIVDCYRTERGSLRYRWSEDGVSYDEPEENIFHIRGFGGSPLGGLSTLTYGREAFGLAQAANKAAASTFKNGMRPTVQFTFENWLTDDQVNTVEKRVGEKYAGAINSGRPFIAEGGMKLEAISMKPEDAQMLESRGFDVEEICRFFGVPPFMVGHTEKTTSWGTGLEQQTLGFVKFSLTRRLKRIEQAAAKQLLTPVDRAAGYIVEFNLEGLLRGDSKGRAEFYSSALEREWMYINEVRALENMPPVPWGNEPRPMVQHAPKVTPPSKPALSGPDAEEA